MTGVVALLGGREHTDGMQAADRLLLRMCAVRHPKVAVLLAASPERRRALKRAEAEQWWAALGARARCAFAGEPNPHERAAALVADADLLVLTGGRPWLLRRRLQDAGLGALLRDRWMDGVPIAGSSAGAMALASHAWSLDPASPLEPRPALDLVPGTLVAPHAGRHGINLWAALTQAAHPTLEVLGIPDQTAVIVQPCGDRQVIGARPVVTYRRRRERRLVPDSLSMSR